MAIGEGQKHDQQYRDHHCSGIGLADDDNRQRIKEMNRFLIFFYCFDGLF